MSVLVWLTFWLCNFYEKSSVVVRMAKQRNLDLFLFCRIISIRYVIFFLFFLFFFFRFADFCRWISSNGNYIDFRCMSMTVVRHLWFDLAYLMQRQFHHLPNCLRWNLLILWLAPISVNLWDCHKQPVIPQKKPRIEL